MAISQKFFDPQTLIKLKSLQLRARRIVEGVFAGLHRSPFQGFSIEFSEHREYAPGDDLRHLDWKVFGRTDKFYLKSYEDETNLTGHVVVDRSESMFYRGPNSAMTKYEYACCLAASLTWLILEKQDSASLFFLDHDAEQAVNVGSGAEHLNQIIQTLESAVPVKTTAIENSLNRLTERLIRRGVVILFTDFFDEVDQIAAGIRRLRQRDHDIICFHMMDAAEIDLPFKSPTRFKGLEQFQSAVADPASLRKAYKETIEEFLNGIRRICLENRVDYCFARTDANVATTLSSFLHQRSRRYSAKI